MLRAGFRRFAWAFLCLALLPSWPAAQEARIDFQGNDHVDETRLREAAGPLIGQMADANYPVTLAAQAAERMEAYYLNQGYFFATVEPELVFDPLGVRFLVDEGPRVEVDEILFEGNQFFSDGRLRGLFSGLKSGFLGLGGRYLVAEQVQTATDAVRALYESEGFGTMEIIGPRYRFSEDRQKVDLSFSIREGPRFFIREVALEDNVPPESSREWERLREILMGKPYNSQRRLLLETRILEWYGNAGYPDAVVDVSQRLGEDPTAVLLSAAVAPGPQVRVARIEVIGNSETAEAFILSRVQLQPGEIYSLAKEQESLRRLYNTGLFQFANAQLEGIGETRPLVVAVTEAPMRGFSLDISGNTYEYIRGEGRYEDKNLFGSGRRLRTGAGLSFKDAQVYASFLDPWLLYPAWRNWTGELNVFFRRRDEPAFLRDEYGGRLGLNYSAASWLGLGAVYAFTQNNLAEIRTDQDLEGSPRRYRAASLTLRAEADTRNDLFFPTSGQHSFLVLEGSHPAAGSQITYGRVSGEAALFLGLTPDTVLAGRYGTGLLVPGPGQHFLPVSERFFLGGERTVRSYPRDRLGPRDPDGNPEGGFGFNLFNFEVRQRIYGNIIGYGFFDAGNITPNVSREQEGERRFAGRDELLAAAYRDFFSGVKTAVGGGVAVLLPVGPLRLDAAANPNPGPTEADYQLLFSIGMAF